MPKYGKRSKKVLATLCPELKIICRETIKIVDISLLSGHRGRTTQNRLCEEGKSKLCWPLSKHNQIPSKGLDFAPYFPTSPHIRWEYEEAFCYVAGIMMAIAKQKGIKLRWGGNWNGGYYMADQSFMDWGHVEIKS